MNTGQIKYGFAILDCSDMTAQRDGVEHWTPAHGVKYQGVSPLWAISGELQKGQSYLPLLNTAWKGKGLTRDPVNAIRGQPWSILG